MPILKRIRVIKKIQEGGAWRFVSLQRAGRRYVWDPRPGTYYLEWWDGGQRRREVAGDTPSQAIAAQRRKQIQLAGGPHEEPDSKPRIEEAGKSSTPLADAHEMFLAHSQAHSPDKPETVPRVVRKLNASPFFGHLRNCAESAQRAKLQDNPHGACLCSLYDLLSQPNNDNISAAKVLF